MASPSPVPPKRREVELSTWEKELEEPLLGVPRDTDSGIGDLAADQRSARGDGIDGETDRIFAVCGEPDRLGGEIEDELTAPSWVAREHVRQPDIEERDEVEPFGAGVLAHQIENLLHQSPGLKGEMVSSASPDTRTVSARSRCLGVRFSSKSREVIPMTPFMGVRIT